jgi:phage replication-related protein YjqB (UPF0714/DUF867 family)
VADLYSSYTDLAAHEVEGVSYERRQVPVTGASWAAIAIHGGGIEAGSGEVARAVSAGLMAHYEFAGIKSSNNFDLHVTSTNFNEPICQGLVGASSRTLSFHGYTGDGTPVTSIGGLDTVTRDRIGAALTGAGFSVISAAQEINGSDPANICNLNRIGAGVQIEMSQALRASFFPNGDLSRAMRDSGQRTSVFDDYVAAVRSAYDGQGRVALGSVNVSRWATVPCTTADVDLTATVGTDALAVGGPHFVGLGARLVDTNNCYVARVAFNTDQTLTLTLRKRVAGVETLLATAADTSSLVHAAGARFGLRFQVHGSQLQAKVWAAADLQPPDWAVSTTDTSLTAVGAVGTRATLSVSNTNPPPVTVSWDLFQQVPPLATE